MLSLRLMPIVYERNLSLYEWKMTQNKIIIIKKLKNMKYKEGSLVTKHLRIFQDIVNQLTAIKMMINDELHVLLMLADKDSQPSNKELSNNNFHN